MLPTLNKNIFFQYLHLKKSKNKWFLGNSKFILTPTSLKQLLMVFTRSKRIVCHCYILRYDVIFIPSPSQRDSLSFLTSWPCHWYHQIGQPYQPNFGLHNLQPWSFLNALEVVSNRLNRLAYFDNLLLSFDKFKYLIDKLIGKVYNILCNLRSLDTLSILKFCLLPCTGYFYLLPVKVIV